MTQPLTAAGKALLEKIVTLVDGEWGGARDFADIPSDEYDEWPDDIIAIEKEATEMETTRISVAAVKGYRRKHFSPNSRRLRE